MSVAPHLDRRARTVLSPEAAFAIPALPGRVEVPSRGNRDLDARFVSLLVAPIALPAVARATEVSLRRDFEASARVAPSPVASLALPAISGVVQVAVLGNRHRCAGLVRAFEAAVAPPFVPIGPQVCVGRQRDHQGRKTQEAGGLRVRRSDRGRGGRAAEVSGVPSFPEELVIRVRNHGERPSVSRAHVVTRARASRWKSARPSGVPRRCRGGGPPGWFRGRRSRSPPWRLALRHHPPSGLPSNPSNVASSSSGLRVDRVRGFTSRPRSTHAANAACVDTRPCGYPSKRSRVITLVQASTKSCTNCSRPSSAA